MRFSDKVVLITGGGTGIGKATAICFAKEGGKIAICGRREEVLKETVAEIAKSGGEATYFVCNVAESSLVNKLVQDTVDKYGRIDILFNNAGIMNSNPIEETTDEDINQLFDINVKGEFWALRAVIRQMRKQGSGGAIVNMSSVSGLVGELNTAGYCATKGAISNLTRAVAMEVARDNIRVNAVCPGVIYTPMFEEGLREDPTIVRGFMDSTPMKRVASPEEVAKVVLFLASDDASFVTAVNLPVDGGYSACNGYIGGDADVT